MMQIALFVLPKDLKDGEEDDPDAGSAFVAAGRSRTSSSMSSHGPSSKHSNTSVHRTDLLRDLDSGNPERVEATVAIIYTQIENQWPLACYFLETMACIHRKGIPAELFYKPLPEGVNDNAAREALSKLVELALITRDSTHEKSQFTMHALVQASIQNLLSTRGKLETTVCDTATHLLRALPDDAFSNHEVGPPLHLGAWTQLI